MSIRGLHFSKLAFVTIFVVVILTVFAVGSLIVRAGVNNLYALSCLGGWENTHLASGVPQGLESGNEPVFTESNSAKLNGDAHAQIYCGGFSGDVPESTIPKKILVKFSWAVEYPEHTHQPLGNLTESPSTTTQESVVNTEDVVPENSESLAENGEDETSLLPDTQPVEPPPAPEVIESIEPEPQPHVDQGSAFEEVTTSFFDFFVAVAYAEEVEGLEASTSSESVTARTSEPVSAIEGTQYGLVEVLYTLNGVEWKSLGFVGKDEFSDKSFEIPIEEASQWEDISKIQIGVQSVPVVDGIAPIIYFDSVWIETEYEFLRKDGVVSPVAAALSGLLGTEDTNVASREVTEETPEEPLEEELPVEKGIPGEPDVITMPSGIPVFTLSKREFKKEIIVDAQASHRCEVLPFSIDVSGRLSISAKVNMKGSPEKHYEAEIGSLPLGIDVIFSRNGGHVYRFDSSENALSLRILNQDGSLHGNFTIPIILTEKSAEDDSSVICQINVVNQ